MKWRGSIVPETSRFGKSAHDGLAIYEGMFQGDDQQEYIGRQFYVTKLRIKGRIIPSRDDFTVPGDTCRITVLTDKQAETPITLSQVWEGDPDYYGIALFNRDYLDMQYKVHFDKTYGMATQFVQDNTILTYRGDPWNKDTTGEENTVRTFQGLAWDIANTSEGFPVVNLQLAAGVGNPASVWVRNQTWSNAPPAASGVTGTVPVAPNVGNWQTRHMPWKNEDDSIHTTNLYYKSASDTERVNTVRTYGVGSPNIKDIDLEIDVDMVVTIGVDAIGAKRVNTNKLWVLFSGFNDNDRQWNIEWNWQYEYYDV